MKCLKPALTLFLQLEQIHQLSQIKQNPRQPESFLISVKEDIRCVSRCTTYSFKEKAGIKTSVKARNVKNRWAFPFTFIF